MDDFTRIRDSTASRYLMKREWDSVLVLNLCADITPSKGSLGGEERVIIQKLKDLEGG
jgi:hypothetical protein